MYRVPWLPEAPQVFYSLLYISCPYNTKANLQCHVFRAQISHNKIQFPNSVSVRLLMQVSQFLFQYTMRRLAGRGKRGSRLDLVWRGCMRDGVLLSRFSATTSGKACSLRGGAALPTSRIRTAPSPHRRPSQLFHLYYLHAPTSTPFSLVPCNQQSASCLVAVSFSAILPCRLLSCPPTHLVQSSSLSTTIAPLDPSTDGTNSSNGSAGRRSSATGKRRPRESPHLPMTFKTRRVRISPIICPRGTSPLLSIRALRLILIIAARVCPSGENASRS